MLVLHKHFFTLLHLHISNRILPQNFFFVLSILIIYGKTNNYPLLKPLSIPYIFNQPWLGMIDYLQLTRRLIYSHIYASSQNVYTYIYNLLPQHTFKLNSCLSIYLCDINHLLNCPILSFDKEIHLLPIQKL